MNNHHDKHNENEETQNLEENPPETANEKNRQSLERADSEVPKEETGNKIKGGKHQKKSAVRKPLMVIGIIVGVLLVLALAGYLVVHSYLSKINYDDGSAPPVTGVPLEPEEDESE